MEQTKNKNPSRWGYGITGLILSFVIFMSGMVYMSVKQDFYLVTDNYYSEGINFDKVQEKIKNVKALESKLNVKQSSKAIQIVLPSEVKGGTAHFFRPSNGTLDFTITMNNNVFEVDKTEMLQGKWVIKFNWTDGKKEFYLEEDLFVL